MLSRIALAVAFLFAVTSTDAALAADASTPRASRLVSFESEAQVKELAQAGPTVIFFFAKWCPNCKAAALEFSTKWDSVRPGIALVVADYDKETEMKTKYGVTYQDTYVLVGPDLGKRRIWNSGGITALNANTPE